MILEDCCHLYPQKTIHVVSSVLIRILLLLLLSFSSLSLWSSSLALLPAPPRLTLLCPTASPAVPHNHSRIFPPHPSFPFSSIHPHPYLHPFPSLDLERHFVSGVIIMYPEGTDLLECKVVHGTDTHSFSLSFAIAAAAAIAVTAARTTYS